MPAASGIVTKPIVAINYNAQGGRNLTDNRNVTWVPHTSNPSFYSSCTGSTTFNNISGVPITNPLLLTMYQSACTATGTMTINVTGLAAATYRVVAHNIETSNFATLQTEYRVFSILAEGIRVVTNWDLYASAGNKLFTVVTQEFLVPVADGTLNLELDISALSKGTDVRISGLEVYRVNDQTNWLVYNVTPPFDFGNALPLADPTTASSLPAYYRSLTVTPSLTTDVVTYEFTALSPVPFPTSPVFTITMGGRTFASTTTISPLVLPKGVPQSFFITFAPPSLDNYRVQLRMLSSDGLVLAVAVLSGQGVDRLTEHLLHPVANALALVVDANGDGQELVSFRGSGSHTHEAGYHVTSYSWRTVVNGVRTQFSTDADTSKTFAVGTYTVELLISDDSPNTQDEAAQVTFTVAPVTAVPGCLARYFPGTGVFTPAQALWGEVRDGPRVVSPLPAVVTNLLATQSVTVQLQCSCPMTTGTHTLQMLAGPSLAPLGPTTSLTATTTTPSLTLTSVLTSTSQVPLQLSVDGALSSPAGCFHDQTLQAPFLNVITPTQGTAAGGDQVQLQGGAWNTADVEVWLGNTKVAASGIVSITFDTIVFTTPALPPAIVEVSVRSRTRVSNSQPFQFVSLDTVLPKFTNKTISKQPCGRTGPCMGDYVGLAWCHGKLYVGAQSGMVAELDLDEDYNIKVGGYRDFLAVTDTTLPQNVRQANTILGMTCDPWVADNTNWRLYIAHTSVYYWVSDSSGQNDPKGAFRPYLGFVSYLTAPNFNSLTVLISGLNSPAADHGISNLDWDASDRSMFVHAGHVGNAGVSIYNEYDGPFSGAILKAKNTWKSTFRGAITYKWKALAPDNYINTYTLDDQRASEMVDVDGVVDVEVFSQGFRNHLGGVITLEDLNYYVTDNGPNANAGVAVIGPPSPLLTAAGRYGWPPNRTAAGVNSLYDKLFLTKQGAYHGTPNVNRAWNDPRQWYWWDPTDRTNTADFTGAFYNPLSSTNGIDEYRAYTFRGAWRNRLAMVQWGSGVSILELLGPSSVGELIKQITSPSIFPIKTPGVILKCGPGGVIITTDQGNGLRLNIPIDSAALAGSPLPYDVYPFRAPENAGSSVFSFVIGGANFNALGSLSNIKVMFGGAQATLTSVSAKRIAGYIPSKAASDTSPVVDVKVIDLTSLATYTMPKAFRYLPNIV